MRKPLWTLNTVKTQPKSARVDPVSAPCPCLTLSCSWQCFYRRLGQSFQALRGIRLAGNRLALIWLALQLLTFCNVTYNLNCHCIHCIQRLQLQPRCQPRFDLSKPFRPAVFRCQSQRVYGRFRICVRLSPSSPSSSSRLWILTKSVYLLFYSSLELEGGCKVQGDLGFTTLLNFSKKVGTLER